MTASGHDLAYALFGISVAFGRIDKVNPKVDGFFDDACDFVDRSILGAMPHGAVPRHIAVTDRPVRPRTRRINWSGDSDPELEPEPVGAKLLTAALVTH